MTRIRVALFTIALVAWGCSDKTASPTPDSGPPPVDQCRNASDQSIVWAAAASVDGGIPDAGGADGGVPYPGISAVTYATSDCVQGPCATPFLNESPDLATCLQDCLVGTPAEGLSPDCTDCWVELTWCAADNCLTLCAVDPSADACWSCTQTNCIPRLAECTGLPADPP